MTREDLLLNTFIEQFGKAKAHLQYSFDKVKKFSMISETTPEEDLESWESFAARFARTSDIVVSKVLRRIILSKDPAFRGSVIDLLNASEKFGWIESADAWRRIRELRNIAAHDYASKELGKMYAELISLTPHILRFNCGKSTHNPHGY